MRTKFNDINADWLMKKETVRIKVERKKKNLVSKKKKKEYY